MGKSWASLKKQVTFTVVKDGKKCKFLCYKGEEFIDYDLILEEDTEEENGVLFEMPITSYEFHDIVRKSKQKLAYYDTVVLVIDGVIWQNKIYRNSLFQWSSNAPDSYLHLCLKDVYYKLDFGKLGISSIPVPVAIRMGLEDGIIPTPSRENILMNKEAIDIIKEKIAQISKFLIDKYNEGVGKCENIMDVWDDLNNNTHRLTMEGTEFSLTGLPHKAGDFHSPKMDGVKCKDLGWYKSQADALLTGMHTVAYHGGNHQKWKTKSFGYARLTEILKNSWNEPVRVDRHPIGNHREYIKTLELPGKSTYFFIVNPLKEGHNWWKRQVIGKNSPYTVKEQIKEFLMIREQVISKMRDLRNVFNTPEYDKWLVDRKAWLKSQRGKGIYKGSSLNKKQGDVTLGIGRVSRHNWDPVFDKVAIPIEDLESKPYLIVYTTERSDKFDFFASRYGRLNRVKFCLVGKLEAKKLPNIKKIIKFEHFMSKEGGKTFGRMASAILFDREVTLYNEIIGYKSSKHIENLTGVYKDNINKLTVYVDANECRGSLPEDMESEILRVAEENKLFDKQLWDIYLNVKAENSKYEFVSLLKEEYQMDEQSKQRLRKLINQQLLFQKKHYGNLEEYDVILRKKKKTPEEITEELSVLV